MLCTFVAQEYPKLTCDSIKCLFGCLHQGLSLGWPLAAQAFDTDPKLPFILRKACRKRLDLRMGYDLLRLFGLKWNNGLGQISVVRHRARLQSGCLVTSHRKESLSVRFVTREISTTQKVLVWHTVRA